MNKLIPFGDRILVKRKVVGEKVGSIILPDSVSERATDLAVVTHVPENTFADKQIIDNADKIIKALTKKSIEGDSDALISLLRMNEFVKLKTIQEGDEVMISKYVGVSFNETGSREELTLVSISDVIGLVVKNE